MSLWWPAAEVPALDTWAVLALGAALVVAALTRLKTRL